MLDSSDNHCLKSCLCINMWNKKSLCRNKSVFYFNSLSQYETNLQVMMMVFSPSQEGLSAMILACVVTSCGDSWGDSLGCV